MNQNTPNTHECPFPRHLVKEAYDGSCCSSVLASTTRDLSQSSNHEHWSVLLRSHEQWLTTAFDCVDVKTKSWSTWYNPKLPFKARHVVSCFCMDAIKKTWFKWVQNCYCHRRLIVWLTFCLWQVLPGWLAAYDAAVFEGPRITCDRPMQPSPSSFISLQSHMIWPWSLQNLSLTIWFFVSVAWIQTLKASNENSWKSKPLCIKEPKDRKPIFFLQILELAPHASLACSSWEVRSIFFYGVRCWKVSLYDTLKVSERNSLHRTIEWKEITWSNILNSIEHISV